jgi:hypothetical protein
MLKGVNSTTFDAMVIGLRKITEKLRSRARMMPINGGP